MREFFKIGILLLLMLFATADFIVAQQPYFREFIHSSKFEGAQINCFYQDKQGFIYIGTNNGVYQFDGITHTQISITDSIGSNNVTCIFDDIEGKMWFGYENGKITTYNHIHQKLIEADGLYPQLKITSILETADSSMVFGTYGDGIFVLKNNIINQINTATGLSDDFIYTMVLDKQDKIWAGTDYGINIIEFKNNNPIISTLTDEDGLPDFIIKDLTIDKNEFIWIGTHDSGVCHYDPLQRIFEIPTNLGKWTYGPVNDILLMDDRIWIATDNNGIIEYSQVTKQINTYEESNTSEIARIKQLLYDKEGNILLASNDEIHLSFGSRIEFIYKLNNIDTDNIHALTVDSKNRIWFANDDGIFRFDPNGLDERSKLENYSISYDIGNQKIMSLYEDNYGFIWIGTFGKGIIRLNPNTREQIILTEENGLVNGNVLSIKGTENEIWFATLGGASKVNLNSNFSDIHHIPKFNNFQEQEGLSNNFIYHLYIDSQNKVWFATDGSGVSYYEDGQIFPVLEDSFYDKIVYSVTSDNTGNIWMNVANEGLYKYDGETIVRVLSDPDHKNLSFSGLFVNNYDELVMVYNEGIDVLDIQSRDIIHYESNAGLTECNPDLNAIDADSKGNIWIGTALGLVKYSGSSKPTSKKPVSIINQVSVFLEKIDPRQQNSFSYNDNHFSFNYSGLWFQYPEKVDFHIQLEGHDIDWIKTKNNSVIYSNLKPGEYTFKIKSALYNNFENASIAKYSFTIKAPFWATYWFYIVLLIVLGLSLYFYIKYRENRIKQKQEALQEKIKFQFENLKSQINPHFLFNSFSTLIALIESNEEAAVEYVEELSELFRNILEFKDHDTISIQEEMNIINNYYKLQKRRYGNNLRLKINNEIKLANFKIPPMTIQMLIENAIKHNIVSKDKPLNIKIYLNDEQTFIYIENNLQVKKDNVDSTGIGIQNIINRYKLLSEKEIEISKTNTTFMVGLPVIN